MQHFKNICCCLVTESCPTLCDPLDCSSPGSFVHWISQARILERVAISSFKGSSQPRAPTHNSCIKNISIPWHKWIAALQLWSLTKSACRELKKKKSKYFSTPRSWSSWCGVMLTYSEDGDLLGERLTRERTLESVTDVIISKWQNLTSL